MTTNGDGGAEPLQAEDPRRIGMIPLVGRLGAGGMGRVYLGVHDGRYVAVKQVLPSIVGEDPTFLRRFGQELDNLARLPAEATAPLVASDRTARPPWLATAYVPGLTLREAVDVNGGPLPADALWLLLRDVASGLAAVHALDMVHRDVKPSNVMLTLDGLTLIDFGVARAAEQSQLTSTGVAVGTPAYMAPEQASGVRTLTGAVDVFALGSVLAYAATGEPPFGDESGHGVLYRIVHEEPDLQALRALDPELAEVVESCLAKDPEGRPTAAELLELASAHGPFEPPLWPEAIAGQLSERAAFAANVPDADELSIPVPVPTLPGAEPGTPEAPEADAGGKPERRERRRRTRIILAVVPVVVVTAGATLAIRLLPYTSDTPSGSQAGGGATPSGSVSASVTPSPSASGASPSGSASPGKSSSASGKGGSGKGSQGGAAGGSGANGSGSSGDGSGGSGGSGGSHSSSGSGTSTTTTAPSSGYYRIKNASNGQCLVVENSTGSYGVRFGDCTDTPAASWKTRSLSGSTYHMVNEFTGQCMTLVPSGNPLASVSACGSDSAQSWRTGSGGTLQNMSNSQCLENSAGWPVTDTCTSGNQAQRWTKI